MMIKTSFVPWDVPRNDKHSLETASTLRLFPEGNECTCMAGLLAYPTFDNLPAPTVVRTVVQERSKVYEIYSIGKCSGFPIPTASGQGTGFPF